MAEDQGKEKPEERISIESGEQARAILEKLQKKGILPVRERPKAPEPQPAPKAGANLPHVPPFAAERQPESEMVLPSEKQYPTQTARDRERATWKSPPTISPEEKAKLTAEARKFNLMAMGEPAKETTETPTPPEPTPAQELSRERGVRTFKGILKSEEERRKPQEPTESPVVKGKRIMLQAERARERTLRGGTPVAYEEMAASRRGGLTEAAVETSLKEEKQMGPLPEAPRAPTPTVETPRAEQTLREQITATPEPPKPGGLRGFFNRLIGRG